MKLTNGYIIITLLFCNLSIFKAYGQSPDTSLESEFITPVDSILHHFDKLAWQVNSTNPELAQSYMDSASKHTSVENQTSVLAQVLEIKGRLYLANARYKEASLDFEKSINLYQGSSDLKYRSGYSQIELGTIFFRLGQYEEAIRFYESAIKWFDLANKAHEVYGKSLAHNNIGLSYIELGDYSAALKSFQKGLKYRQSISQPELIAHSYSYLANAYTELGQYSKADSIIEQGLIIPGLPANDIWHKKLELKKGHLRVHQGKNNEASSILYGVSSYAYANGFRDLYSEINHSLSTLELQRRNYNEAYKYATRGFQEELSDRNYKGAMEFVNLNKKIALAQNDLQKALKYTEKVSALKDSFIIQNESALKDLLTMSAQIAQTQQENSDLQNTTTEYSNVIEDQKGLLIASIVLILLLMLVAYVVTRLNNKLKQNQKNQRELNLRILAVINRTESQIISLGPDGVIRVINKPAINFFKKWINVELKAGDVLEEKLLGTKASASWREAFSKSKTLSHWKEVSQFNIKDQKLYFLENFSSITHRDGTYAGLVVVSNDITKEHEYNVKMSEENNTLEKSNKAKERMLSILAHDLKDAVYSAHSLSELVLESPEEFPKEELIHLFSLLHGNFDKTKSLLDGLLDWMKTQTGGLDIKQTPFNLNDLVSEVFEACYAKSVSKKISLKNEIDDDLTVMGDREMIKTVLRNLVNNSIKYTQPETGCVKLIAKEQGEMISICVKDNGQGISKENQKKLFQGPGKFTTIGTAKEQGTGFGLNLCKELVNLHKSELSLNSEEGEGSEFFFSLPLSHKNDLSKKQLH